MRLERLISNEEIAISDSAPNSPTAGDIWYESDSGRTYIYYDSSWVEIGVPSPLADESVTTAKLAANSVTTVKIQNSAVTASKIADNTITWNQLDPTVNYRNLLYNGAMQVAQRGASGTIGTSANGTYHSLDRWCVNLSNGGDWAMSQASGNDSAGFSKSLQMYTNGTTPKTSSGYCFISQKLEGQDLQLIRKGTANAQQLTLSFWVKVAGYSQMTGTYIVELQDTDNNRHCSQAYTISSLGSWEYKTVTFPADTVGALTNDNNESLRINFWLYAGTDYQNGSLATSWTTLSNGNRAVGQTDANYGGMANISFTGVQLNLGAVAAPFEFKSFGQELQLCKRYFESSFKAGQTIGHGSGNFRPIPTDSLGCSGNSYFALPLTIQKRTTTPTLRLYDYGASHTASENWWRYITACNSGTAVGPNVGIALAADDLYIQGYLQSSTGAAVFFDWTVDAEL